jgi:predicted RNase H-like HicB family nuclease
MSESGATHVTYLAVVNRVSGKGFVLQFPDFPDCVVRRPRFDQAVGRANEAFRSQVDVFVQLGKQLPRPTSLEELKSDPENRNSFLLKFEIEIPEAMAPGGEGSQGSRSPG